MSDEMKSIFQGLNARGKMILPEAATEEQIAAFEKEHTVELPKEYKEYYACRAISEIYGTYGGVAVDLEGHALNNVDAVVPGLYACGEVTGSRDFQETGAYAGGLGPALTTGHIAGLTVIADIEIND